MKQYLKRHAYWLVGVGFFAVAYCLFLSVSYSKSHKYERLKHSGTQAVGTVVAKEPENHRTIRYTYDIGGTVYVGTANASLARLPFDEIHGGDHIPVTYLYDEPYVSIAGDASILYFSWSRLLFVIAPIICLLLSIPLAVFLRLVTWRWKRTEAQRGQQLS